MRILLVSLMSAFAVAAVADAALARVKLPYRPTMYCVPTVLRQAVEDIEGKFGPVQIISTHRPGATVAGTGRRSKHADCRAVDFNPPAGKHQGVVAWLKANHKGGIGTYSCGMHHVHIDNGAPSRWHKCTGGTKMVKRKKSGTNSAWRRVKHTRLGAGESSSARLTFE
ncbi:MAG: D-Ala-D-Ala carboxypeptidase family metallohydrolase [Methyloceanibacter sp.]